MTKSKATIEKLGRARIIHIPDVGGFLYTGFSESVSSSWMTQTSSNWETSPTSELGVNIFPFGHDNMLPTHIRNIMDENNLAPGILEREKGLLYGQGLELYRKVYKDGAIQREWCYDDDVWGWLKSWDYMRYVEMAITEYKYLHGFFDKVYASKGKRIGIKRIAKLEVVPGINVRMGWVDSRRLEDVSKIYVADWENATGEVSEYNVFNRERFLDEKNYPNVTMSYHNSYSYARSIYSIPSFYGALNWIKRSSDVPVILKYITENSINVAYHIQSPALFWQQKREELETECAAKGKTFNDSMLEELKNTIMSKLAETLSGKKNAGKFFHTISLEDDNGKPWEWKIEPIDQKITDFIEAQIKVSEKADSATTSGIGLHPALSNIMVAGKLSSGSEMLYALKLYLGSDTAIPEAIILQSLNRAIAINFPDKDLQLGFYHQVIMKEDEVSPSNRLKNNI
ncbi:MAG: hypothetical protein J6K74_07840 [Marinifilaceae bacterium]|nr:hypothetical protein [Marinifilaceae bacterium]